MTAPTMTTEAAAYLAAVEHELADLPAEERAELLEDLAMHLQELEVEHDERRLEARLGSSESYAAELRTAAGLPPRTVVGTSWVDRSKAAIATARAHRVGREVAQFLVQVRPAWWVLRGYLIVLVPCMLYRNRLGFHGHRGRPFYLRTAAIDFPFPAPFGSHLLGALAVLVAVVASVRLGQRRLPQLAAASVWVLSALLLLATATLTHVALHRVSVAPTREVLISVTRPDPLSSMRGPITNIFPFTADGKPLAGVLLYDQDGRPITATAQQWWPDRCARVLAQPKAADGVPVPQSYPQQYVLDPRGVTIEGLPVGSGQCQSVKPPAIQLPVFAKAPR